MTVVMPHGSLRSYLLALTAGAVVPLLCFVAYLTIGLGRIERAAVERGLTETAGALVSGVDREVTGTVATLEALATSQSLDHGNYTTFVSEALRVLESQGSHGWLTIHLASPEGAPIMNSSARAGSPIPRVDIVTVKQTAQSGKPVVSDLLPGGVRDQPAFAIRVPVLRNGAVRYVLSATISARSMSRVLRSQQDVPDRIAVLYDRKGTIVFRTVNADQLIGTPVTPRLAQESAGHPRVLSTTSIARAPPYGLYFSVPACPAGRSRSACRIVCCMRRSAGHCGRCSPSVWRSSG